MHPSYTYTLDEPRPRSNRCPWPQWELLGPDRDQGPAAPTEAMGMGLTLAWAHLKCMYNIMKDAFL